MLEYEIKPYTVFLRKIQLDFIHPSIHIRSVLNRKQSSAPLLALPTMPYVIPKLYRARFKYEQEFEMFVCLYMAS
jgi:hypothetical protein